jgi:hypothetical protein
MRATKKWSAYGTAEAVPFHGSVPAGIGRKKVLSARWGIGFAFTQGFRPFDSAQGRLWAVFLRRVAAIKR